MSQMDTIEISNDNHALLRVRRDVLIGIEKLHSVKLLSVFEFMYIVFIYTLNYFVTQSFYLAFLSDFLYPKM